MYKDLLLPQPSCAFPYFLTCFNQWPSILKTDYQESKIKVAILRNQEQAIPFFEPNISEFKAVALTSRHEPENKR